MTYERRILHYSPGPTDFQSLISNRAVSGCSFELNRLGGCGAGELQLNDEFANRSAINVGDWIAFEYSAGDRWYMGRVEHRSATVPAGVSFRLEGMSVELGELFAGGFNPSTGLGIPPHRYAKTDLFPNDPDYPVESVDAMSEPRELIILLIQQYVVSQSHIILDTTLIDSLTNPSSVTSMKFRGEESIKSIIKDLALRAGHASWGVQPDGKFFCLQKPTTVAATWRIGRDIISLEETCERNQLYNRITLTGGYIYGEQVNASNNARGIYRWQGNYTQPASRSKYGERRIRMNIPWIRTATDSREFAREFFRVYADPTKRYFLEVGDQSTLPIPWNGQIKIEDKDGEEIITSQVETVRVQFDHVPRFQIQIGPDDPQLHWPEPNLGERWEIPDNGTANQGGGGYGGNEISFTSDEISFTSFEIGDSGDPSSGASGGSSGSSSAAGSSSNAPASSSDASFDNSSSGNSPSTSSGYNPPNSSNDSSSSSSSPACGSAHDTFTDTDGTSLANHTMDIGSGWTEDAGTWEIQSNKAECETGNATVSTSSADVKVGADITLGTDGDTAPGLLLRYVNSGNHWYVQIDNLSNAVELYEVTGGTSTMRADFDLGTVSNSYLLEARMDGNIIMIDVDGAEQLNYESSSHNTATKHGLRSWKSGGTDNNKFDNFCIEEYIDTTQPSCTLTTTSSTVYGAFTVTATFSKQVTGFVLGDISVTNGTASNLAGSGKTYTFTFTPTAVGSVTTSVAAGVAIDSNSNTNSASNVLVTTYEIPPPEPPTNLTAFYNGFAIELNWSVSTTSDVTEQRLYRSTTSGSGYVLQYTIPDNTSQVWEDWNTTPGVTYYYIIRAYNGIESVDSNEASATAF